MPENIRQSSPIEVRLMSANEDFYNNVFKKTERIVSATFYLLTHIESSKTADVFHRLLNDQATTLHRTNIGLLTVREGEESALVPLRTELAALDSTLTVIAGARLFAATILSALSDEIDQVLRYLKHHIVGQSALSFTSDSAFSRPEQKRSLPRPRRIRPQIPKNDMSSDAILIYSDLGDRTTRIKTVLEAKPDATIKDLTDIITDVSAKTIQRDLNVLIEQGVVIRQGERRWSKYSLA
jgi:DNA-binding transcriptional ArsR family regulator